MGRGDAVIWRWRGTAAATNIHSLYGIFRWPSLMPTNDLAFLVFTSGCSCEFASCGSWQVCLAGKSDMAVELDMASISHRTPIFASAPMSARFGVSVSHFMFSQCYDFDAGQVG